MRRKTTLALLLSMVALAAFAQKGPADALGFQAGKLYDFNNMDAVNLFNGNLTMSIPIGIPYRVSSALSYQFMLVYNGKIWDYETWTCRDEFTGLDHTCDKWYPNLRSNAGIGWRVSLGRLLPPYDASLQNDSRTDLEWVYEGPAGDEHALGRSSTDFVQTNVHDGMRMRLIDAVTRDVEFASGEVHRFVLDHSVWRLKQMRDRYNNAVNISYAYSSGDNKREVEWNISDTVGRTHKMVLTNYDSMHDGWSRGATVDYMSLQAAGNSHAVYDFSYTEYAGQSSCYNSDIPALSRIDLPDTSSFQFGYFGLGTCSEFGTLTSMRYPTGAVATYVLWGWYDLGAQTTVCRGGGTTGISSRTINDGMTTREWKYVQNAGPLVPTTAVDNPPCGTIDFPYNYVGPIYWSRTSVLEPVDAANRRVRTDHYFDVYSHLAYETFTVNNPLPSLDLGVYSHSGAAGVPPPQFRKRAVPVAQGYPGDIDGADDLRNPLRLLATEVYEDCEVNGDCSNGRLLRTNYDAYDGGVYPNRPYHPIDTARLVSTRTVYPVDTGCGGPCYTQFTYSDDNGAGQFRTTTLESNFPNAKPVITTVQYPTWTSSDLISQTKAWLLRTYSEKTRNEDGVTKRETFCFDNDRGVMLRHRVHAGATPGSHDLLQVFSYDSSHGDLQFESDYGGDVQSIDTGSTLCSIGVPAQPWYKVESSYTTKENGWDVYTGGIPASARYYDRVTGQPLGFLSLDRTIDRWTGVVTGARDTSGVGTTYSYDAVPARLHSMTTPAGAVTTYAYTNATGSAGGTWTPAKVDVSTVSADGSLASQFAYDGIGRLIRSATLGPSGWNATQTTYDCEGRVATTSEPESTGQGPPPGALVAANKTEYKYDALGRTKSATAPDNSTTTFTYVGDRQRTRTAGIFTGGSLDTPVTVTEDYDGFGRLVSVTEKSGPTTATSVIGADVVTTYAYDAANRLTSVKMRASTGSVQNRIFDYDGRGFLRWESQPESGMTSYEYDPRGHATSKTQSGASTLFDLIYTVDSAERLRRIDGRNPFYSPSTPDPNQPQFRVMKEFDYEDSNNDGTNLRRGKLVRAARYNYGVTAAEPLFKIEDTLKYLDAAGRKTDRNTTISQVGGYPEFLQSLNMSVAYDALDQVKTIKYPMCEYGYGCGVPPTDPDRSLMTRTYAAGRLKTLSGYIDDISYWPNGMRNVLSHANGIADTQVVTNMPRPSQISFGRYDRCLRPTFTAQPAGGQVTPGGSFVLSVSVTGTGPFEFQWFNRVDSTVAGTTQSITVNPTATTEYFVMVINACGFEQSQDAKVTIGSCAPPATGDINAVAQPDGSWILTPRPEARQPRTYSWWRLPENSLLGTSETLKVAALPVTTTFRFTITDSCGSDTADVTIQVPLPITNGLQATAITTTQVGISWPPIAGATQYTLERRSLGVWTTVTTTGATSYSDSGLGPARTYVYRVTSNNGGKTDYDVATTMTFVAAIPGQVATSSPFDAMLTAVNKVREAVGWPALNWSNILATADPVPSPGQFIVPRQILSCRARMNEALQALGVRVRDYTNPDLYHVAISAQAVNEVQQRAQ